MTILRSTRFTTDPADAAVMRERRRDLLAALRAKFSGPAEARLVRVDERTWVDVWLWESEHMYQAALDAAPGMPEAGAAFALTSDISAEVGEVAEEDRWAR